MFESDWDGGERAAKRYKEAANIYLREKINKHQEIENIKEENARLKELNKEMIELIKFFDMDVDDVLAGRVNLVNWAKRSIAIGQVLIKVEGKKEK